MTEREAIDRLKRRDISGLEYLVMEYQVQATRVAYLICRDEALAQDIVQTLFIRAYERIEQFNSSMRFGPWFFRSVANDAIKAAARRERTVSLDDESGTIAAEWESLRIAPGVEDRLERMETNAAVSAAIAQLPPDQRAAIVMRYYLELSDDEMSAKLDCAKSTVRWKLYVARRKLRGILSDVLGGPDGDYADQPEMADKVSEPGRGSRTVAAFVKGGDTR
ncbi:MAG: sigma-70 family RNA polymerase sigma factor [Chloroflexia bacterium]